MCVPTLPKIFRPVTLNILIFLFGHNYTIAQRKSSPEEVQYCNINPFMANGISLPYQWMNLFQRGSYKVWEINMGVCPRFELDYIMFNNCLGYDFCIYGAFEFLCNFIANLWRHVWYHYHTLGYPVIIIFKVIDISCIRRRNVFKITIYHW